MTKKLIPRQWLNWLHLVEAIIANFRYGFPSNEICIVGITGTKGKTTTAYYLYQMLRRKFKTGLVSTAGVILDKEKSELKAHVTTPSAMEMQRIIRAAVDKRIQWLVVETSSHGFDQNRLWGISFDIGIVTNIADDHLDYHITWEAYANAKSRLIDQVKENGWVILNKDDDRSFELLKNRAESKNKKILTYGLNKKGDYHASVNNESIDGIRYKLETASAAKREGTFGAFGDFNLSNALAAVVAAEKVGVEKKEIDKVLERIESPPGRMEIIQKKPFLVIVDFAHNTYSLEEALTNLEKIKPTKSSRLITVFGCPGQRDPKRREMGRVSAKYSNLTIITADDSRTEKVEDINREIEGWAVKGGAVKWNKGGKIGGDDHVYIKTNLRGEALVIALETARPDDIVYVTGMGDQHTMAVGNEEVEWNDKEELIKLLEKK
jgi:UDP-N-acetylmuramoyl-L-alanyl-D-glutamate--2,6-diaminopimelate ligase